jgi:deoxyribose-phosphate aldolase
MIDHALLHPTFTDTQLVEGLALARRCGCATVCVKPCDVTVAAIELNGSGVGVCAVVSFPHGNSHVSVKVAEANRALTDGATEIDVVLNLGKVLAGDWDYTGEELSQVNAVCRGRGALLKAIFETDYLQEAHIVRLCQLCTELGVAFVKTSTGFGYVQQPDGCFHVRGATEDTVRLMRRHSGPDVQVKAAGGIRTLDSLLRFRTVGAARIGTSATLAILSEAIQRGLPGPVPAGLSASAVGVAPGAY